MKILFHLRTRSAFVLFIVICLLYPLLLVGRPRMFAILAYGIIWLSKFMVVGGFYLSEE